VFEQALRSLYREAWPYADPKLKESHLQRHFVDGIADPGLQHYLRLHARSNDFAETVAKAKRYMDALELTKTTKKPAIKIASAYEDGSPNPIYPGWVAASAANGARRSRQRDCGDHYSL